MLVVSLKGCYIPFHVSARDGLLLLYVVWYIEHLKIRKK